MIISMFIISILFIWHQAKKEKRELEKEILKWKVLADMYSMELGIKEDEKLLHEISLNQKLSD